MFWIPTELTGLSPRTSRARKVKTTRCHRGMGRREADLSRNLVLRTAARFSSADPPENQSGENSSNGRAEDRNPRVAPVGATLAGDGQHSVCEPRAEVAGGIDGVAGGSAERKADAPDDAADQVGRHPCGS